MRRSPWDAFKTESRYEFKLYQGRLLMCSGSFRLVVREVLPRKKARKKP